MLDALPSPESIIDKAIELNINMIGISEHESLSSHIRINKYAQSLKEQYPDFKVALGNEIYLTQTRNKGQQYYHSLLVGKNALGHKMLRELSSISWINSYFDRGLQRVPTLYSELEEVINKYGRGNLIMSSACIGSFIGQELLRMKKCEQLDDTKGRKQAHDNIVQHILWCKKLFGSDYYLEIAPALYEEQKYVNLKTLQLGKLFDVKVTIQDDAHRLTQDDYIAHKALLNSKSGEREDIDKFYQYTYMQSYDEIRQHLDYIDCDALFKNSMEFYDKVEEYSLLKNQQVPQVPVPYFPREQEDKHTFNQEKYPVLDRMMHSENEQERYWVNYCYNELKNKQLNNDIYLTELNEEARVQTVVGEKLNTCIFSYPIFLQHYFDLIWECGSITGVSRGSSGAGLDNYLMNLTQYDPIKQGVNNYFRYLNDYRVELPDLDFDLAPSVRPKWFQKIKEERGELGLVQVCTFSTMSARAAILSACRGYRSKDFPNGIDNDQAQYLTSLIGSQRGFTYTIDDMINGNKEKDIKPNINFINAVNQYPGLLDIIKKLEGVISNRSIHASGVVFNDKGKEFDDGAIMTAPDGTLITQWSLHDAEAAGKVKIDSLVTDVTEKITRCIKLLQEYGKIESNLTLKEAYNKYLHPDVLPLDDSEIWDNIDAGNINNLFQFDTQVGGTAVKRLKPRSIEQLSAINALIRLMAQEKGAETPVDRYARIKQHPEQWDKEMDSYGLTKQEQSIIKEYCSYSYGTLPLQDDLMLMAMDERLFGFDLETVNFFRKVIGKKLMDKIPEVHQQILDKAKTPALGKYVYDVLFSSQLGYSFNKEHCLAYSLIGYQCAYLATKFPSIYWNTACLQVDSGLEEEASTNYGKIAKAVGKMSNQGIKFSLIDINQSQYGFKPNEKENTILYGMKALNGIGGEITQEIIQNRPYSSVQDFQHKINVNKTVMISLIKSGAFDQFGDRKKIMEQYLREVSEPKKRLTFQNFNGLIEKDLIPQELNFQKRVFRFNKALRKNRYKDYFILKTDSLYNFYAKFFDIDILVPIENKLGIWQKEWKKIYDNVMQPAKTYIQEHQEELLDVFNDKLFQEQWTRYAGGGYSAWEMDSLGTYYHKHELATINTKAYDIVAFKTLPEQPVVDHTFERNGVEIPIFKTFRIAGTVVAKDDAHSSISVLTPESGVVTVKLSRDYFAKYNRRISEIAVDGTKKVKEESWFKKGTLVILNGIRRGDAFFCKKYSKTKYHQLYKVTKIYSDGMLEMTNMRYGEEEEVI